MGPTSNAPVTHLNASVFNTDAVPTLKRDSEIHEVMEAFLGSSIPNKQTARGYRRHLRNAFSQMGVERLSEIQPIHLANFKLALMNEKHRGVSSHQQALISMRSFLSWCSAMDGHSLRIDQIKHILKVPPSHVITPHLTLSDKEVKAYLAAAKKHGTRDYALVIVALGSGVRIAELVNLDIKDVRVDASGGTEIHVRQGKGSKDRLIPVRREVAKAVEAYLKETCRDRQCSGPLFLAEDRAMGARDNWRLTTRSATRTIKDNADRAGIRKRITPHALRHTFAFSSYIYCRNLVAVQKLLGHATIATTQRYVAHLDALDLRNAIPAFLGGAKGPRVLPSLKTAKAA